MYRSSDSLHLSESERSCIDMHVAGGIAGRIRLQGVIVDFVLLTPRTPALAMSGAGEGGTCLVACAQWHVLSGTEIARGGALMQHAVSRGDLLFPLL